MDVAACTLANVRQASRAISQVYDTALQPVNLKATQFTVLAALSGRGPLPLSHLAGALVMDRTTLTRNLQPLMKRNLVDTAPSGDRRVRTIRLTPQGRRLFAKALPRWRKAQNYLVDGLGHKRWEGLLNDLSATVTLAQE